jgi:hypothetical protein
VNITILMACVGMVAGATAFLLGFAQLTCEHSRSSWTPRGSTALLAIASGWAAIDSWEAWSGVGPPVDEKVVAFVTVLAASWAHRRAYGLTTENDRGPRRA